jgi:hypothetical protein
MERKVRKTAFSTENIFFCEKNSLKFERYLEAIGRGVRGRENTEISVQRHE